MDVILVVNASSFYGSWDLPEVLENQVDRRLPVLSCKNT